MWEESRVGLKREDLGIECEVCKKVPTGFNNVWNLRIGDSNVKICDSCLGDLGMIIDSLYD